MEINFNVFLPTLQRITLPTTTQTEISRILIILQHEMTIHFFSPFASNVYDYNTSPNEKNRLSNENFKDDKDKNRSKSAFKKQNDFDEKTIIAPFKSIWQIFFDAYRTHTSQIRLMIVRALGVFLTRVTPFYPEQISQSFIQTIRCLTYNESRAPLIIASFVFIAHELSPLLLSDFLSDCSNYLVQIHPTGSRSLPLLSSFSKSKDSSPVSKSNIFDHFSISSNDISEHIAPIISKLGFIGHDWLHQLLKHFLRNVQPQPGRHTIHAISATINHYPREFLKESIETLKEKNIRNYISIFAFYFYTYCSNIKAKWKIKILGNDEDAEKVEGCFLFENDIDITCFIDIAFDILKERNAQFIDDALQILSILSDLEVNIIKPSENREEAHKQLDESKEENPEKNIIITFNYSEKYHDIQMPASFLIYRSSFYRLSLPLSILKPSKSENILISSSKFHTLAYYAKEISAQKQSDNNDDSMRQINLDEITQIFHDVFSGDYNEYVSSAYQAISTCFKDGKIDLYKNKDNNKDFHINMDIKLIRHILFCPMISWFHCIDVLKFISTLNLSKIDLALALDIVDILIEFSLNKNSKLSSQAASTILDFATPDNYVKILEKLIKKNPFFDVFEMEKLLPPITSIVKRFGGFPPQFEYFLMSIIEIAPFMNDKYTAISLIFDLVTVSGIENRELIKGVIYQAYVFIVALYEISTGKTWIQKTFNFADCLNSKKSLWAEIDLKNIDIITDPTDNIRNVFELMRSSLNVVFTFEPLIDLDFDISICERCFELFPYEVSKFIYKIVEEYPEKAIRMSHYYRSLKFINDNKIFQIWCRIVIKRISNGNDEDEVQEEINHKGKNQGIFSSPKIDRKNKLLFIDKEEKFVDSSSSGSGCGNNSQKSKAIQEAISFLTYICYHFFNTIDSSYDDLELIATFAVFPIVTSPDNKKKVLDFLKNIPEDRLKTVLYYAKKIEPKGEILLDEFKSKFDETQLNNNEYISKQYSYPNFIDFKFEINGNHDPDSLLMMAIHSGSKKNVKKALEYIKANDFKIKIPKSKMKTSISDIISKWLGKNQFCIQQSLTQSSQMLKVNTPVNSSSNVFVDSDQNISQSVPSFQTREVRFANDHVTFPTLIDALSYVSTRWKTAAVATIKKNSPDNLLFQLCSMEKVPKYLLLNLCKIVDLVKFDKNKLFNVCNILLYEAKTTKRQRITMRLFTTSMMYAEMIPPQIVNSFVAELGNLITTLPFYELTLCIKTIGKVIQYPTEVNIPDKAKEEPTKRKILVPDVPQSHPRIRRKSMFVSSNSSSDVSSNNSSSNISSVNSSGSISGSNLSIDDEARRVILKKAQSDNKIRKRSKTTLTSDFDSSDYDLFNINKRIYNLQDSSDLDEFLTSSCESFDLYEGFSSTKEKKPSPPKSFMQFAQRVRKKLSPTNYLYGNIQVLFFQYSKSDTSIIYQMDEEDNLVHFLDTTIPSKFLIGMRQFSMRLKTMTNFDSDRFVKNILRTILGKVFDFIELPFFTHLLMEGIIKPLLGSGHWNYLSDTICKTLAKVSFTVPHYMAIYPSLLKWLPLGIRTTYVAEFYSVSASLFQEVSNPKAFSLAIQCLVEKLNEMKNNPNAFNLPENESLLGPEGASRTIDEKKDELLMDSILIFLERIEQNDSLYLTEFLMDLSKVIARFSTNSSFITMIFTQFYKKCPRFFPAFAAFAQFVVTSPNNEAIPTIKESIIQITDSDLKRRSVKLLSDKNKIKEALILAQNADKIILDEPNNNLQLSTD